MDQPESTNHSTGQDRAANSSVALSALHGRQAAYQQTRLAYGVTGIGLIIVFSWVALWNHHYLGMTALLNDVPGELLKPVAAILLLGFFCALVQTPIDLMAQQTDRIHGQMTVSGSQLAGNYLAGLVRWLIQLAVVTFTIAVIFRYFPESWAAILCLLSGLLILLQQTLSPPASALEQGAISDQWLNELNQQLAAKQLALPEIKWIDHGERTLNGSWLGLMKPKLYLTRSLTELPARQAAILIARELGHRAHYHRVWSMLATWFWINLAILTTCYIAQGLAMPIDATGLVLLLSLVGTQLYFAGLFIWPALGRFQVRQADLYPLRGGFTKEEVLQALSTLSERNLPDESLPDLKAYIFHPIPPMSARRMAIEAYQEN